ncbi:hypothetical protein PoB_000597500 [Plakobranchus ocellatus]|uniref:Uncharacterized protein n=1 Tax=Plakobranchus ocellatus TaxID=259542 RepID=A0AAV3Y9M1_9GAST|nr:hypothetical protein PoB_000597500 [Plakobranchus ocellatus]
MSKKKNKSRSNGHGWLQEIPSQHHQRKTAQIVRPYNQGWTTRETVKECQNMWKEEQRFIDSLNKLSANKEGTNNELMRQADNREEWRATIDNVCKTRPDEEEGTVSSPSTKVYKDYKTNFVTSREMQGVVK